MDEMTNAMTPDSANSDRHFDELVAVAVTFENMDYITIPAHYFKTLQFKNISRDLKLFAVRSGNSESWWNTTLDSLAPVCPETMLLEIYPEVEEEASTLKGDWAGAAWWYEEDDEPPAVQYTVLERLRHRDITYFTLLYADGSESDTYNVQWDIEDCYTNRHQTVTVGEDGVYRVYIEKGRDARVSVYSRDAIEELIAGDFPENAAVISFCDPPERNLEDYTPVDYSGVCDRVITVPLHDTDMETLSDFHLTFDTYFPEADAVADFIKEAHHRGYDIICQCEWGQSRSAACAAAIMEYYDRRGIDIFSDYRYCPNQLVYNKILAALKR